VADGRTLAEIGRAIDRLEAERDRYVRRDVYIAERDAALARIARIEADDTTKATGTRTWLLNLAGTVVGVIVSGIITVLIARGGH
jgi:hypothetical protein